ncbi:hypothetical protein F511_24028 [Dorcoceras hygrometricum]|uniref:Uncharacterized protein n=1 Tax=Dorcoceras hygrometricum TaxID=472368 RepID=A0A2Z7AVY9_9LAMI|nr:hypothetical protein F511_24028 [Dorcoceras hygrometricum]
MDREQGTSSWFTSLVQEQSSDEAQRVLVKSRTIQAQIKCSIQGQCAKPRTSAVMECKSDHKHKARRARGDPLDGDEEESVCKGYSISLHRTKLTSLENNPNLLRYREQIRDQLVKVKSTGQEEEEQLSTRVDDKRKLEEHLKRKREEKKRALEQLEVKTSSVQRRTEISWLYISQQSTSRRQREKRCAQKVKKSARRAKCCANPKCKTEERTTQALGRRW